MNQIKQIVFYSYKPGSDHLPVLVVQRVQKRPQSLASASQTALPAVVFMNLEDVQADTTHHFRVVLTLNIIEQNKFSLSAFRRI